MKETEDALKAANAADNKPPTPPSMISNSTFIEKVKADDGLEAANVPRSKPQLSADDQKSVTAAGIGGAIVAVAVVRSV